MSSSTPAQGLGPPQAKRLKVGIACLYCRSKKVKCDGIRPACGTCQKKDGSCTYTDSPRVDSQRRPISLGAANETPSPHPRVRHVPPSVGPERSEGQEARGVYGESVRGVFSGEVTAAIDARLGLPSGGRPSLVPMIDAPLFGFISRPQVADNNSDIDIVENVLPQRKHADSLVDIYWRYIQPLEPFLDPGRFSQSYQALFSGDSLSTDERIFTSTLNTVFALSTQWQEGMQPERREGASNIYFHRAWTLLRPESIVQESGSLELVQCLLIMSRYLQCTNNPHQTWMVVGSAVRIAQSLGLHIPEVSLSGPPNHDTYLRRHVWQCCVFMDRGVSWVLGRTSMACLTVSSAIVDSLHDNSLEEQSRVPSSQYFAKTLELYEIANHIMLAQTPACSTFADRLGLPRLYRNDEYTGTVLQLDACLSKWEKSLPLPLKLGVSQGNGSSAPYRQGALLRLRLLHCQIHLFRPMLARFCLSPSQTVTDSSLDQGLGDRFIQECASFCVDSAQKMIALVHEHQNPEETVATIPWWFRIFYLHVAGTILIAATLRTDLFTPIVSQSWSRTMSTLRAHEHLSPYVQQCVTTFQTLSSKISESHQQGGGQSPPPDGSANTNFQDVFLDMGFDPDNFLFGKEDMSWLGSFELT